MGILRFILAFSVVISHSQPIFGFLFVGPVTSVQAFYIISGFYMSLILNEKYTGPGFYKLFMSNRILRLFPIYLTVLTLSFFSSFAYFKLFDESYTFSLFSDYFHFIELKSMLYLIVSQIIIFGQDVIMFLQFSPVDGSFIFTPDYTNPLPPYPPAFLLLFVPQAWTLSLELLFYLIAPLLVKRNAVTIGAIIAASLALRFYLYSLGLNHDPWTYRFFPTELAFFLSGALSYKIYRRLLKIRIDRKAYLYALLPLLFITVAFQFIPSATANGLVIKQWAYYLMLILLIPAIFIYSKNNALDRYIGELSYPIYISHIFVLHVTTYRSLNYYWEYHHLLGYASLAATVLFSIVLVHFISNPLERYRQRRIQRSIQGSDI